MATRARRRDGRHHRKAIRIGERWAIASAFGLLAGLFLLLVLPTRGRKIQHSVSIPWGVDDPRFERAMGALFGPPLLPGNQVVALQNGDEVFPAMLQAIAR